MSNDCIFCTLRDERIIGECDYTKTFIDSYPASPIIIIVTPTIVVKLIKHITHFFKIPTRLPELIRVVTKDTVIIFLSKQ
jgi:diadenosine tetraphosphate (Ap4A) HIT family hydrolase